MTRQLLDSDIREDGTHEAPGERRRRLAIGRLGGALFCAAALVSVSSALTLDEAPPGWVFGVIALAFGSGLCFLALPWHRLAAHWLHVMPLLGTFLIAGASWGAGADGIVYDWFYMIVVLMVAHSFRRRAVVAGYLGLVSACLAAPVINPAIGTANALSNLIITVPTLAIATVVVIHFRERLEAGKDAYQTLSLLDPLTGVGNYRSLYERLDYEIARHERYRRCFAVMLLDLREFKQVNEGHGHLEGDRVLSEVGRVLAATIRDQDTVARHGGDEFSVLAPETSSTEVAGLAARLQAALGTIEVDGRVLTASIGWAIYPGDGATTEALLRQADTQLLDNKARSAKRDSGAAAPLSSPVPSHSAVVQPR